jgi:hypothetical protein
MLEYSELVLLFVMIDTFFQVNYLIAGGHRLLSQHEYVLRLWDNFMRKFGS